MSDRAATVCALLGMALIACRSTKASEGERLAPGDAGGVPASVIATGSAHWVDSIPDKPLINARVDVGTLHMVGADEIDVLLEWPSAPGSLMTWRSLHPEVTMPDGTKSLDRERIVCRAEGPFSYRIESRYIAPDGREVARDVFDPAVERARKEKSDAEWRANLDVGPAPYGRDSRSLACLAAASKCRGEPLVWPPPRNETPLEHSERATKMRAAYNAPFVPGCKL